MTEFLDDLNVILLINSIFLIGLILNLNESTKDSLNKQNQSSVFNPLEKLTWVCLFLQMALLVIKVRFNNF